MSEKEYKVEEKVAKVIEIEQLRETGLTVPKACEEASITEKEYYKWRKEDKVIYARALIYDVNEKVQEVTKEGEEDSESKIPDNVGPVNTKKTKLFEHKYQGRKEPLLLSGNVLEFIYLLFSEGVHIVSFTKSFTKDNLEFLKAAEVKTSNGKSIKLEYYDEKSYIFEEVE